MPGSYSKPAVQEIFAKNFNMETLHKELVLLENHLLKLNSPVVFCHNDLLYGNLIYNEEKDDAFFIDYEYGSYSFRGFDIANHFNEMCGFECEYENYPNKEVQYKWLSNYLSAGRDESKGPVSEEEVARVYREVNKFALASHFYWGVWALVSIFIHILFDTFDMNMVLTVDSNQLFFYISLQVQAQLSDIDFDYMPYAVLRFAEYFKRRDEFLAL